MYLNQRTDLGDVSQGKLVTIENYYELFNAFSLRSRSKGLRLLVTPFPQQQYNETEDRRSEKPSRGAACFDAIRRPHQQGKRTCARRPSQESRHRIVTPPLRGVQVPTTVSLQRALKTVEDFTQFEQAGAYFDGDHVIAAKKGLNPLNRINQVDLMAEFQEELGFPPAPKLTYSASSIRARPRRRAARPGNLLRQGPVRHLPHRALLHDNLMHDLKTERFFKPVTIKQCMPPATVPSRPSAARIKNSPPYMHDGRLLTLDDTVEFFNLILGTKLTGEEKRDLVAFLRTL